MVCRSLDKALRGSSIFVRLAFVCTAFLLTNTSSANPAITTFNKWCFKAGQTEEQARANMNADTAAFALTFWDASLEPTPENTPYGVERRCEIEFDGDHSAAAVAALRTQMAVPPVFGTPIELPETHNANASSTFIQGRELQRGRVAVVHVGLRQNQTRTFIAVDRLPASIAPGDS